MSSFAFITNKHKLLLMLRDDKPTIPNPNCWSLIGGRNEPGEEPEETLFREIKEEININQLPARFLWKRDNPYKAGDVQWLYHIELPDELLDQIQLGDEGQRLEFFTFDQLHQIQLTQFVNEVVTQRSEELKGLLGTAEST